LYKNTTAKEISDCINGVVVGKEETMVNNVASIEDIKKHSLSFAVAPNYYEYIEKANEQTVVIVPESCNVKCNATLIKVANPQISFIEVLNKLFIGQPKNDFYIDKTAQISSLAKIAETVTIKANVVVEEGTVIEEKTVVMQNCVIGENVKIGKNCIIYPNVSVMNNVSIGDNCIIHSGAVLGSDGFGFVKHLNKHVKIPQVGTVEIGNDVEIGANTTVDKAAIGSTIIGEGTKIDNLVQIAHNVVIGKHCIICGQVGISGSTKIGDYVILAGQVGLTGHINIGDYVIVGAKSGVSKNVAAGEKLFGYPAMKMSLAKEVYVLNRNLPNIYKKVNKLWKKFFK
jgi:UDP-3-O-[3-hydroxymyristoyl] glucosamine N-acyltransferase